MTDDSASPPPPPKPHSRPKQLHVVRAADALRDNLRRRKAAARKAKTGNASEG